MLGDFLSFRLMISPALLLVIYYAGALGVPIMVFYWIRYAGKKMDESRFAPHKHFLRQRLEKSETVRQYRTTAIAWGIFLFIMMEVFWRMMFEFFIAYFQMHNALIKISG